MSAVPPLAAQRSQSHRCEGTIYLVMIDLMSCRLIREATPN